MKYNIMESNMEGKAKINFNLTSLARTLKISYVPKNGKDINVNFKLKGTLNKTFTSKISIICGGVHYIKFEQDVKFKNTAKKLMVSTKYNITLDPFLVFFNIFC